MTQTRDARLAAIVDHLVEVGSESAKQLSARFAVSVMTVHRDLDELEQRGLVRKFHGGASVTRTGSYEIAAAIRRRLAVAQKQALARAAVESVRDGQAVMIDDSSTASAMIDPLIRSGMTIQVITNYLPSLTALSRSTRIVAQAIGGEYDRSHESYLGVGAVDAVRAMRPDIAFVSSTTADAAGIYHQEERIVTLKQEMLRSAGRRVLLLDETKIGATSLYRVCGWELIDELITTDAAPAEVLDAIDPRVTVTVIPVGPTAADQSRVDEAPVDNAGRDELS